MESTIGHARVRQYIDTVQKAGRLSHAYCFVGADRLGKRHIAMTIVHQLLGKNISLDTHPDVRIVEQTINPKTGKLSKNITIDQLRDIRTFLRAKPFIGAYKIVLIDHADKMTTAAANALLKSLEEPAGHALLLLTTSRPDALPQTILSRCQQLYFSRVAVADIVQGLEERAVPTPLAQTIAEAAHGRPGVAIQYAMQPETLEAVQAEQERFTQLFGKPFYKKRAMIEDAFAKKEDHIAGRIALDEMLQTWLITLHQEIENGSEGWTQGAISIYNAIEQARRELQRNVHPRLLLEHILLAMP